VGGDRREGSMPLSACAVEIFQRSEFLAGLSPEQGEDVLRRACRAGETLFSQGDPADCCYLVIAGRLKLSKVHEQRRH
jgi:CRP-like cAMP-binding protein